MRYTAKHRFVRMSARKIRPFASLIRGRVAAEAMELLRFYPNRGARFLEAVVRSAMGNAEYQGARDVDELLVVESRIDDGPIIKRIQPRARGTAYMILKRMSHITITLADEVDEDLDQTTLEDQEANQALSPENAG